MASSSAAGRRRPALWTFGVVVLTVVGLGLVSGVSGSDVRVVEGWAMPDHTGAAISLHDSSESDAANPGEGYIIAGADWRAAGSWHDGADLPTCVGTDPGSFTHVRMGVVDVQPQDAPARAHVVWLECLD